MKAIDINTRGCYVRNGVMSDAVASDVAAREKTLAYRILRAHEQPGEGSKMHIRFDALISHDITYVGIIQTARASGLKKFPVPYAMTNCHNSLCAVGGTINEDDHVFGLSAAKKYGGIYVPANQAVIHQFAREMFSGCGKMILGSDSHTRYGCYGALGVGEGGGELVKQLLEHTWDIDAPEVVLVWLEGELPHGIGPHDVALALIGEVFAKGIVKNKILEFAGPGVASLSMDVRAGIDVMTTETSCLSSIWVTDETVKKFFDNVGRPDAYAKLEPEEGAYYDCAVTIRLNELESMIALPFHPSNTYTIHELQQDPKRILQEAEEKCNRSLDGVTLDLCRNIDAQGRVCCDQSVIVGCAGGMYDNIAEAAAILDGQSVGDGVFNLSVYPSSTPVYHAVVKDGFAQTLLEAGAVVKTCFCGPCFGAGDTPSNNGLSIRHATRNFANREGSKPSGGQIAAVALMDARSIAATARNGGVLTAATDIEYTVPEHEYHYNPEMYKKRCYFGYGKPDTNAELKFGPNIADWPEMPELGEDLLVKLCAVIHDDVTTTDELIPSGETSSYRSNPELLSEFALSRRVPEYVARSKEVRALQRDKEAGKVAPELKSILEALNLKEENVTVGSCVFARKPGDGSAREQAASCQKVLGGFANIAYEYATKRYRSNCINWGVLPFTIDRNCSFDPKDGQWIYVPSIRSGILAGKEEFTGYVMNNGTKEKITLQLKGLSGEERKILVDGCLINYYRERG